MSDPMAPTQSTRIRSPARATAVVYAMLIVSLLAFPAGVTEWFADRCEEGAVCRVLLSVVHGVERASHQLGVAGLFEQARDEARHDLDIDQD